ncbi:MAG TPA: response regulator, partial [Rudaea sp.]
MTTAAEPIRVLIIDDDEDDVFLVRAMFKEIPDLRAHVDSERSFASALDRIERERHDIYLVDYRIGAETGIDWLRRAHEKGLSEPVIMLTGQGSLEIDLAAMEAGAADYLVKSQIDSAQLGRSVRYALDRERYRKAIAESELRYRQLFEHVPMPMWVYDLESYRFVEVNDAAILHYGYSRPEFLAMTTLDIRPAETVDAFRRSH